MRHAFRAGNPPPWFACSDHLITDWQHQLRREHRSYRNVIEILLPPGANRRLGPIALEKKPPFRLVPSGT